MTANKQTCYDRGEDRVNGDQVGKAAIGRIQVKCHRGVIDRLAGTLRQHAGECRGTRPLRQQ